MKHVIIVLFAAVYNYIGEAAGQDCRDKYTKCKEYVSQEMCKNTDYLEICERSCGKCEYSAEESLVRQSKTRLKKRTEKVNGTDTNAEENSMNTHLKLEGKTYFIKEGDILIPQTPFLRKGVKESTGKLWPNGSIPYVIDRTVFKRKKKTIALAMKHWTDRTCIKFVPKKSTDMDYVHIVNRFEGCYSYVGRNGGKQELSADCPYGSIIHELGHAIGFVHEQSRPDRDDYITIKEENIVGGKIRNFKKYPWQHIETSIPYDYGSIMHYSPYAFSKNGEQTIVPKVEGGNIPEMGQRKKLSEKDIEMAKLMYKCENTKPLPECKDKNTRCERWTKKNYCESRVEFMTTRCPFSCKTC